MRSIRAIALFFLFSTVSLATPFNVSTPTKGNPDEEAELLNQLRTTAVVNYLSKTMGPRYTEVTGFLKPDVVDGFILDYQVSRAPGKLILTGRLDVRAIRGWATLTQTRQSNAVRPCLFLSSTFAEHRFSPADVPLKSKESALIQATLIEAGAIFKKLNAKLVEFAQPFGRYSRPPQNDEEISNLRAYAGEGCNTALWIHYVPCPSCGGARMDAHLYSLTHTRQIGVHSEDLALPGSAVLNAVKVKAAVPGAMQGTKRLVDEAISRGALFTQAYLVSVEGLQSFGAYRIVEKELKGLDSASQVLLKRVEPRMAEFEILTPLKSEDLVAQLRDLSFGGLGLKPERVEGNRVILKAAR